MDIRLRNIFVLPQARHMASTRSGQGETLLFAVDGLVCTVCAARTRTALLALPGVTEAAVDFQAGRALIRAPTGVERDDVRKAISSQVVFPRLRAWLAGKVSRA